MKKVMYLWDIIFINVTAIIGLRWLPIAAGYGASAPMLWILAAGFFLVPLGLVSSELATAWPKEGGLYVWVKEAYGEKSAFFIAWFYWINSFFYWPSIFTFIAVTTAFLINPALAHNKLFICSTVLIGLWTITLINLHSMRTLKLFSKLGGTFGIILPGLIIVGLGLAWLFVWHKPSTTNYSLSEWLPNFSSKSNIAMLSTLMFSMAGIELTPILAGETNEPQKTFPRATLISAFIIVGVYIISTMAITFMIAPQKIGAASGIMDALHLISSQVHLPLILPLVALMIILGSLGAASVWLVAPIKLFFESCRKGLLPQRFMRLNKNDMPSNAMIVQAVIVSIIIIFTALLPSVNIFYETLVIMATITYFIPYLAMFSAFMKLRHTHPSQPRPYRVPGGRTGAIIVTICGLFSVLLAIILPLIIPPADITDARHVLLYRAELVLGVILFGVIGYAIYAIYEMREKKRARV